MNEWDDLGRQIQDIVQDAVGSRNFGELNQNISRTINIALREISRGLGGTAGSMHGKGEVGSEAWKRYSYETREARRSEYEPRRSEMGPLFGKPRGNTAAVISFVCGIGGVLGFGCLFLFMGLLSLAGFFPPFLTAGMLFFLALTVGSAVLAGFGVSVRKRNRRFAQYRQILGTQLYISVSELAAQTGRTPDFIRTDLMKMIHLGYFPQARLDDDRNIFMLNRETYMLYRNSMEQMKAREQEEAKKKKQEDEISPEVREVMQEGVRVVQVIHEANDRLPEEEISAKLDRLEDVVKRIFEYLVKNPKKLPDARRFIQYYLPTTCKLVKVYQDLDEQGIQTENIVKSKEEIRRTLDTINAAFENLLDSLFEDVAMDVSSDISVLQTMLEQEGLTGSGIRG